MSSQGPDKPESKESCIQKALNAYNSKQYPSISKTAHAFAIPHSTFQNYVSRGISQNITQKLIQILSNIKKNTLARWITCFIITKYSASLKLVLQMAKKIYYKYIFLVPQTMVESLGLRPIGHN